MPLSNHPPYIIKDGRLIIITLLNLGKQVNYMICLSKIILNIVIKSLIAEFFKLILESTALFKEKINFTCNFHISSLHRHPDHQHRITYCDSCKDVKYVVNNFLHFRFKKPHPDMGLHTQIKVYYAEISLSGNCLFLRFSVFRSCDYIALPKPYNSACLLPFFQPLSFFNPTIITQGRITVWISFTIPKLFYR